MLSHQGWKSRPSPRRGFTMVEAQHTAAAPVVVAVHDAVPGIRLFRCALDEAMGRLCDLVVLDCGVTPLRDRLREGELGADPRDLNAIRTVWSSPHVRVERIDPGQGGIVEVVSFCESAQASLLVIGADQFEDLEPALARRIFSGDFDVLLVHAAADTA